MRLYAHQERALELLTQHQGFALLMEQGTGKTLPMLMHLTNLMFAGEIEDALIVGPLSALGAWTRDIDKHLSGSRQKIARERITLINYDKLSRKSSKWQKMCDRNWGAVVLDEAHAVASRTSNRTRFFIGTPGRYPKPGLNLKARYRYLLTGTLIGNGRLEDIWAPFEFIAPGYLGEWRDFEARYLTLYTLPGSHVRIIDRKRYRNAEHLIERIAPYIYRVRKIDCLDLPEKMPDDVISVPLHDKTKSVYAEVEEAFIDELDIAMANPLVVLTKSRQVASGFVYDDSKVVHHYSSHKPAYLRELMEGILPEKVVVFAQFKPSIAAIQQVCKELEVACVTLDGDQPDKNIWRKFQEDDDIKVFIGQYQSANSGIDLYSATHTIYYEPTNSTQILEQSRDRTHRVGVRSACNYYHLITADTIEEEIYRALSEYQDFTEARYLEIMSRRRG